MRDPDLWQLFMMEMGQESIQEVTDKILVDKTFYNGTILTFAEMFCEFSHHV